ncbi:pre-mycofactocin synthase MftD [Actinomycetospora cinnamomea]|uniref:L-lactate dehydrogenase (Cytochrome) n=1 Tax=Actinomycetospora cinnamomea TaxID=663609 RepID=A0A2U1FB82_9PSEU|nr:pre-mycofactocin synthase MftD [Actinomycetospora cinnamomea]PVZ09447.1 L-lactate dehydrogenase (cytochrome) [Actinomycetospora cinnamomea]
MAGQWFESVAEAQRRARKRLPRSVYGALVAGSEAGATLEDNVGAFRELEFLPHVCDLPFEKDLTTTVMGQEISMPVMVSPTGVQAVNPEGEVAVARAAKNAGTAMGLSSFASRAIEDVVEANDKTFFQMYWVGDRDTLAARAERAKSAGAKGLIVTLDWSFSHGRDWGSPSIPEKMDWKTILKYIPEGVQRPRWGLEFLRSGRIPDLTVPNIPTEGEQPPTFFGAYGQWMFTPPPTWADVAWLREQWGGDSPFCVKGITRIDDAKRAVDAGATAIQVSNHGGNNLDSTPAPIRVLPGIVEAVGRDVEVIMDGGIRRGSDVVKALCLGARAVAIGRAYLWGLAANGQAGVENVFEILRSGIGSGLMGLGRRSVHDLVPEDLIIPPNFTRQAVV